MNLYNIQTRVRRILQENVDARNSDELLISIVDTEINPGISKMPYFDVMSHRHKYGLPSCESIRRCRQKLQADEPELAPTSKVKKYREDNQAEFEEFARS